MFNYYKQLDDGTIPGKPVVLPFNPDGQTPLDRKKTLEAMKLIKKKHFGKTKGITYAYGRKQRKHLKLDEIVYSPTCSTK